MGRTFLTTVLVFLCFSVFPLASEDSPLPEEFVSLFEKVELEELPPADEYYVDDSPLNQILKLFDEEDYARQKAFLEQKKRKVIKNAGGLEIPNTTFAQDMIHDYLARYMTNFGKQNLYKILDDAEIYRLFVREELKKRNMPAVLEFLPVVESEYKATAKSRSGARGMWQFMENSMHPFLKKNEWIDERLDPWKATQAALTKLQDNYRVLGDWQLAIGAYNCGLGAMRRAVKKSRAKTFWAVAEQKLIPEETINYVPKLLAIAEITENGSEYGAVLPELNEKIRYNEFDYVTTKREISLEWISSELRLNETILKKLNPELLKEKTPPSEYKLRLPEGLGESLKDILR
ncbi:MAG: lytic transglycosylase domain-containing protein [Treponema sp.]|nr:lytic transglycosylase domain-containing protein [Treponema sp.]